MQKLLSPSIYGLTKTGISDHLASISHSRNLSVLIFEFLYKKNLKQDVSASTWQYFHTHFSFSLPKIVETLKACDGTFKFLIEFDDGLKVETVLIPFHKRYTVCLSSQVGCALKCSFCHTGTQGFKRNLKAGEIIAQYLVAKNFLEDEISSSSLIPNIVFMGQGEPLLNFDEVKTSLEIMLDPNGLALGPRQITLSTAGYLPGIKEFHQLFNINLALSLHSPFNQRREKLIPLTAKYPLQDIFAALDGVKLMKRQFITFEYLLIEGVNDRSIDADELQSLLGERKAIINLIPFNPVPGINFKRPSEDKVEYFKEMLVARKLRTMIRSTKGSDILAACGQLIS